MDAPPSVSPDVLAALPAEVLALIQWQARQIAQLQREVADLKAQLTKNSTNSSVPPSATHPHAKPASPKPQSKRRRGGQPGHPKPERALIPPRSVRPWCPACPLLAADAAKRSAAPIPNRCGTRSGNSPRFSRSSPSTSSIGSSAPAAASTCGELPPGVPSGQAGPRLVAFAGLLMACFRQSKRRAAQFLGTILNQPASAGWMVLLQNRCAEAVQPAYDELAAQLPDASRTEHRRIADQGRLGQGLGVDLRRPTFTFFACRTSRGADVLDRPARRALRRRHPLRPGQDVLAVRPAAVVLGASEARLPGADRQTRATPGKRLGHDLMRPTKELFALWKRVRDGTISRPTFDAACDRSAKRWRRSCCAATSTG